MADRILISDDAPADDGGLIPFDEKASRKLPNKVKLFLDSGVFGSWQRGEELDLKAYIQFVKRFDHLLFTYATMDMIPGRPGVARTRQDVDASAETGYRNHQVLKDAGLKPIPIFHQGESYKWLERYLKDGEPYIGLATAKDMPGDLSDYHRQWLDDMFSILTNDKGVPYVKTHGFGITKVTFLMRYPWYTCDSTTWSLAAGYGMIYVPPFKGGKPDYTQNPIRIIMSGRTQESWSSAQRQYGALPFIERKLVDDYITHIGLTPNDVIHLTNQRRVACIRYFNELCETMKLKPFAFRHPVDVGHQWEKGYKAPKLHEHMHVIFATIMANRGFSKLMNAADAEFRLVSYYDLKGLDEEKATRLMHNYVKLGIDDPSYEPRTPGLNSKWNENYISYRKMKLLNRMETPENGTQSAN